MFTGIIEKKSIVKAVSSQNSNSKVELCELPDTLTLGESVAINGVCLTVAEITGPGSAIFDISPETLSKTNLQNLQLGDFLNIERALKVNDRLSGHWVQGHVDAVAKTLSVVEQSGFYKIDFEIPDTLTKYCVAKGSICINGISLTINTIENNILSVQIIPHTWNSTNLSRLKTNHSVNIEVDILAKYVEKLCLSK